MLGFCFQLVSSFAVEGVWSPTPEDPSKSIAGQAAKPWTKVGFVITRGPPTLPLSLQQADHRAISQWRAGLILESGREAFQQGEVGEGRVF